MTLVFRYLSASANYYRRPTCSGYPFHLRHRLLLFHPYS